MEREIEQEGYETDRKHNRKRCGNKIITPKDQQLYKIIFYAYFNLTSYKFVGVK